MQCKGILISFNFICQFLASFPERQESFGETPCLCLFAEGFLLTISDFQVLQGSRWSSLKGIPFVLDERGNPVSSTCDDPVFPALIVKEAVFPPVYFLYLCKTMGGCNFVSLFLGILFSSFNLCFCVWNNTLWSLFLWICGIVWSEVLCVCSPFSQYWFCWSMHASNFSFF